MKKIIFLSLLFSCFLLFAESAGTLSFVPKVETAFGFGDYHDNNKIGFGAGFDLGYTAIDNFSVEGGVGFVYWMPEKDNYKVWMIPLNIGLRYEFLSTGNIAFALVAGGGVTYVHVDITNSVSVSDALSEYGGDVNYSTSDTKPSFYAGAEFSLKNIILRPKFNMVFLDNMNSTSLWLEIGYRFSM